MKVYSYREIVKIVKSHGFELIRNKGSHHIYKNSEGRLLTLKHNDVNRMIWQRLCKEHGFTEVVF